MAVALKVVSVEKSRRGNKIITYEPTFSGNYGAPTTGADPLSFANATNPSYLPAAYPGGDALEVHVLNPVAGYGFQGEGGAIPKLHVFDGAGEDAYTLNDIKGATAITAVMATEDQAAAPVNAAYIAAAATFTAIGAGKALTIAKSPDVPRNVNITIFNDSGGALNLYEGQMTFTVTGKNQFGQTAIESITFTSTAANKAVANTKYRMKAGAVAFASITSIVFNNAADGGLKVEVGPGTKLGLPAGLENDAEGDVLAVAVKDEPYDFTGKVDGVPATVATGTLADGDDVQVIYRKKAEFPLGKALPAALTAADTHMRIAAIFPF